VFLSHQFSPSTEVEPQFNSLENSLRPQPPPPWTLLDNPSLDPLRSPAPSTRRLLFSLPSRMLEPRPLSPQPLARSSVMLVKPPPELSVLDSRLPSDLPQLSFRLFSKLLLTPTSPNLMSFLRLESSSQKLLESRSATSRSTSIRNTCQLVSLSAKHSGPNSVKPCTSGKLTDFLT